MFELKEYCIGTQAQGTYTFIVEFKNSLLQKIKKIIII